MIKHCPRCNQRYVIPKHNGDFVHICNSGEDALDKEAVVVLGEYVDDAGVTHKPSKASVMLQGKVNRLQGTEAGVEGFNEDDYTTQGIRQSTHRERQHFHYIE